MKKNLSILFVVMLVASMILSACGGSAPVPAATKAPVEEPAATNAPAVEAPAAESGSWLENAMNNISDQREPTAEEAAVMDSDFQIAGQVLGLSGSGTAYSSIAPEGTSAEDVFQYFRVAAAASDFTSQVVTLDSGETISYGVFPNPDGGNFIVVVTPITTGTGIRALAFEGEISAPVATEAPVAATEAPASTGSALVENNTDFDWCEIYVSPASEDNWGDNQLADGVQIAVGESFTLQLPTGVYDISLTGCDGSETTLQVEVSQ